MADEPSEEASQSDKGEDSKKLDPAIERLKIYVGLVKFAIGTVALGVITLFFNEQYRRAQLDLEREKSNHALELQDKRAEVEYLSKFVANAMDKDFHVRVDFADYMKSVALSKTLQEIWSKYYAVLSKKAEEADEKRQQLLAQRDDVANRLTAVGISKPNEPSTRDLVDQLQQIYTNLYLVQDALDRTQYGSYKQNYFDFQSVAQDATAAQRAGNYTQERDLLLGAVDRVPKDIKPYFLARLAGSYRALHDFPNANKVMQEATDLAPTADSLYKLAIMQKNNGRLGLALASLDRASELSDGEMKSQIAIAKAGYLIQNGQRDEGIQLFDAIQPQLQPRDDFIGNIAWFNAVAGRKEEFYDALQRALQVQPQSTLVWIDQEVDIDKYRDEARFKKLVGTARSG